MSGEQKVSIQVADTSGSSVTESVSSGMRGSEFCRTEVCASARRIGFFVRSIGLCGISHQEIGDGAHQLLGGGCLKGLSGFENLS
jgi:hypothetical protein